MEGFSYHIIFNKSFLKKYFYIIFKMPENYDYFLVKGGSMLPTIKPGQKVKILKTNNLKVGDIIVFGNKVSKNKKNNIFRIVHRIVKINGNKIITKGDNRLNCDRIISYDNILGKVIKVGNKKIDTPYYNFISPFISKISYYSIKINPRNYKMARNVYNKLKNYKIELVGNKNLHIKKSIHFFFNLPYKFNQKIFSFLNGK